MARKLFVVIASVFRAGVIPGTALADSRMNCKGHQQYLNDSYIQQFRTACDAIVDACIDERRQKFNETAELAFNACWDLSLSFDPRFRGPYPSVLIEFEKPAYDGPDVAIACAYLRSRFTHPTEDGSTVEFKDAESVRAVGELFAKEPDNLLAMS